MKNRKVDENTEVYALIIKQVNGNMTHVCISNEVYAVNEINMKQRR